MKISNHLIVRPSGQWVENLSHSYLMTHRISMLHIVNKSKPDKSLCGRNIEFWDLPYRSLEDLQSKFITQIEITDKDFCKRCLKKFK